MSKRSDLLSSIDDLLSGIDTELLGASQTRCKLAVDRLLESAAPSLSVPAFGHIDEDDAPEWIKLFDELGIKPFKAVHPDPYDIDGQPTCLPEYHISREVLSLAAFHPEFFMWNNLDVLFNSDYRRPATVWRYDLLERLARTYEDAKPIYALMVYMSRLFGGPYLREGN